MSWDKLIFFMAEHWHLQCQSQEDYDIVSSIELGTAMEDAPMGSFEAAW